MPLAAPSQRCWYPPPPLVCNACPPAHLIAATSGSFPFPLLEVSACLVTDKGERPDFISRNLLGWAWAGGEGILSLCVPGIPQTEFARYENGHYLYRIHRSPLCEYMINFIHKLKHLPEKYMMNSVLENFTILQVRHGADAHKGVHQWVVPMASLSRVLTLTFFSPAGGHQPRHTGDLAVYCICF